MKIYTRGGDTGETSLLRGGRVPKHHLRVEAFGALDELNSWIGYIISFCDDSEVNSALAWLQPKLHMLCSDVAAIFEEGKTGSMLPRIRREEVTELEQLIDRMDEDLPMLTHFILPGGSRWGAALHVARTVCRRAERCLSALADEEGRVNPEALKFLNRLSDYLFTLARWTNHRAGKKETPWIEGEHTLRG